MHFGVVFIWTYRFLFFTRQITTSCALIDCASLLYKCITTLGAYGAIQVRNIYVGLLPTADSASHIVNVLLDNETATIRAGNSQWALVQDKVTIGVVGTAEERSAAASRPTLYDIALAFRFRTGDSDRL